MAVYIIQRPTCTEKWDDDNGVFTRYSPDGEVIADEDGTPTPRPYSNEEKTDARFRKRDEVQANLDNNLKAAVDDIVQTRNAAEADVTTAQALHDQARTVANNLVTQRNQIAGWTPSSTYRASDLALIRDQIRDLCDRQAQVANALADFYAYRKANDIAVVRIYDAVLWLARRVAGRLVD